jgi:twitching motility protein PilT
MIHYYPADQRDSVRQRLADNLMAIVAQRLVPKRGGRERILVTEVLVRSPTVQDCIRDANRLRALPAALDKAAHEYGSHSFDQQLVRMVRDGLISLDTAKGVANSPSDLVRALKVTR